MALSDRDLAAQLGSRIGHSFRDSSLAATALTHRSRGSRNYERLEFLGDSVLNLAVARLLYLRHPTVAEGELSRARARLVNRDALAHMAGTLQLGELLRLGEAELKTGGNTRPSILADALEAVIGALFCDAGYDAAEEMVRRLIEPYVDADEEREQPKDAKTRLQEWRQSRREPLPRYELAAVRGEAHDQTFCVACVLDRPALRTEGEGKSRKAAEQQAAQRALDRLQGAGAP